MSYAKEFYHAPINKLELLPLGYDPELFDFSSEDAIRSEVRSAYNIAENSIVIIHGGKIIPRRKTFELIEAVFQLNDPRVNLIIFGGVAQELADQLEDAVNRHSKWLRYTGHLNREEYCRLYLASDIAAFPGGQSVVWQEAIGGGLPLLVSRQAGIDYLDLGGNIKFIDSPTPESIYNGLQEMIDDDRYLKMRCIAKEKGREYFSYERISDQVLKAQRLIQ